MWARWHSGGSYLIKAAVGTVAVCATATSGFLSPPPASATRTSPNIWRAPPCSTSFYTRARAIPTTVSTVVFGGRLTDQQIDSYSFREIIGDKLLAVEDAEKGVTREVSAKEILKGKHVAIYFANTDMEKQQEREKQLKQRKQEGMPNYVRSISIVKQAYDKARETGKDFEVVYVPLCRPTPEVIRDTSLLVTDEATQLNLMRKAGEFCVLPLVLVEDDKGEIVTRDGFTNMLMFPDDFPWKNKSMKEMLSPTLGKWGGEQVDQTTALKGKTLGVYMDASWSDACTDFMPTLKAVYEKLQAEGKPFEIVSIVLRPRSQEEFTKHFAGTPWFFDAFNASPYGIKDHLMRGTPDSPAGLMGDSPVSTLLLFDDRGHLITADGRDRIINDPEGENFPWQPKPWPELPEDPLATFGTNSFVVFMEGVDKVEQARIREVVKKVADARNKSAEAEKRVARPANFFTVSETGSYSKKLRKDAGLDSLNELVPQTARVVLLDTVGGRAGVKRDGELTEESLAAFVAAWETGESMLKHCQHFKLDVERM